MNDVELRTLLHTLPPELPDRADRFRLVQDRVRSRRRRGAAGGAAGAAVLLVAVPLGLRGLGGADRAVDQPATDSTSAPVSPTAVAVDDVQPGGTRVVELGDPVTFTGAGTETVPLGTRPAEATAVRVSLGCLDPGKVYWPDGGNLVCGADDVISPDADPATQNYGVMELSPGQTAIRIRATAGMSWKLTATYVHTEQTEWGVNARGETFGVENDDGTPDLVAVIATNGREGYAYDDELSEPQPKSLPEALAQASAYPNGRDVPVYESDGQTQIGTFHIAAAHGRTEG